MKHIDISWFRFQIKMRFALVDQAVMRAQVRYLDELIKGTPTATPKVEFKPKEISCTTTGAATVCACAFAAVLSTPIIDEPKA